MIIAVVGAGGKTSLIRQYAAAYLEKGLKVFVTTSTHMMIEADTLLTDDADAIIRELEEKHYVMAGIQYHERIKALPLDVYRKVCQHADVVLVEADGSKHKPVKFPNQHEPVIYDNVDEIIVVCGLHALHKKAFEAAHRLDLVKKCLNIEDDTEIRGEHIQKLVMEGYVEPLRKKYPDKTVKIKVSHNNSDYQKALAELLESEKDVSALDEETFISDEQQDEQRKIGCVIMASGLGVRFGGNKLMAEFQGKTFIQRVLDLTASAGFAKRVVVTRNEAVREICREQKVDVIFHDYPNRNDTVRLGIDFMYDTDGCMFCPCDQPLLKAESLKRLMDAFLKDDKKIYRLSYGEKQGTPILFGKMYFRELDSLPEKCGGSYLIRRYPESVDLVSAGAWEELFDIDTQEDYNWVVQKYC
ncbi:selenium cofactor biosynthesis protein YqeC [Frisingicoccus sp.]|uniref:selenium cofactor biosynthesis protein YqeC n=1 Tax=Frisingicoccus sp. TaxID=1918627 RepID=UPI003868B3AC